MKLSCVPLNFGRQIVRDKTMTNEDWIDMAVDFGLDGTEIYENFITDLDEPGMAKLADYVHGKGLEASMFTSEPHLCNPEGRGAGVAHIRKAVDGALIFGADIVRVVSGHGSKGLELDVVLQSIADGLRASLDYAEEKEVRLAFEDHWGIGTNVPDFMKILELVDDERLKVNLDTANVGSENIVELTELVKDRVVHTHCSELLDNKHGIVIGKGEVDFKRVLGTLKDNGYDGWISLEPLAGGRDDLEFSVNHIRDTWNSL
jgi:sugar phosphate isomerase/epimerase|tara:strand:+ start:7530 stop:8309 length:780 start_codon:yes stop_codon:yes gene_type:complete